MAFHGCIIILSIGFTKGLDTIEPLHVGIIFTINPTGGTRIDITGTVITNLMVKRNITGIVAMMIIMVRTTESGTISMITKRISVTTAKTTTGMVTKTGRMIDITTLEEKGVS